MNSDSNPYRIKGVVIDNKNLLGLKGLRVEAWDKDFFFDDALGFADTNQQGIFEIYFDENRFQNFFELGGPDLYFKIFHQNICIASTENYVLWNRKSGDIPVSISIDTPVGYEFSCIPTSPINEEKLLKPDHFIHGRITDSNKTGLAQYTILLSEYDLDGTTKIDCVTTGRYGAFEFEFAFSENLRKNDDSTEPDLVFQVFDSTGTQMEVMSIFTLEGEQETAVAKLSESKQAPIVLMNTSANLTLRIVVDLHQPLLTEFEQLIAWLNPFMGKVGFADLKEDETHFQISFLSKESGVEKTKIEQLRDAFKQAREFDSVPAWAFFGLATQNISLASLDSIPLDELVSALKPLQPTCDKHSLESVANSLKQYAQEHSIQAQVTNLKTSVGDLLQPILASEEKLNTFLDAYARHEGDPESFWQAMSQNREFQAEIPSIQLNLQLSQLTLNNKGLINALQQTGIENTRQLVDVSAEKWEALALEHKEGIPLHISGKDDLERSQIYAQELHTLVEVAFPTDVIKKSIQMAEVNTFLNRNPEFDFTLTPVETYLHSQGERAFRGIENSELVKNQLRKIQRLYTVTANAADMNVLMDIGYESAHQIAKLPVENFQQNLTGKISEENAKLYHAKASAVSDATAMVYHAFRDLLASTSFKAANDQSGKPQELLGIPDWRSLFGSIDTCECQHCKSVYSPAAYFVDLLHILLGQNNGAPRKEIFRRRPDLLYTKLSCEHTENLIPYIDLVNEVLETYVAQENVGDDAAKAHAETSTNDTSDFSASDLAANPQHPNLNSDKDAETAYTLLKSATYPLNLPYDMDLEVARQFLQEQNSSRFELIKTFGNVSLNTLSAERLGVSEREFEILTLKQLDGISNAKISDNTRDIATSDLWSNATIPADAQTFLDGANIAYTDLIDLLKTRFLNEYFPINVFLQELSKDDRTNWLIAHPKEDQLALQVIELASDSCDLSKTLIKHLNGNSLSDVELSCFIRFIRLWKKLGCTISELDNLLMAVGATDFTPQVIQDLSVLWQVQQDLNLSIDKVAALIGTIPSVGKESLFARLFLNKAILQIDKIFILNVYQTELEKNEPFKDHIPAILAAISITEEDFNRIAAYTTLNLAVDTLNLVNLSKIYRYVIFAKGLRIKIKDLMTWLNLIPQVPWNSVADLIKTKDLLEKLNGYGFKAPDFAYIFNNEIIAGNMLPPKDEIITQSAKTLREGLLKIRQENTPKDGIVTVDFLKMCLGILLDSEEVTKVVGILDESNKENKFDYLLTPKISDNYKDILQNYLTAADIADLSSTADITERFKKYWDKIEVKLLPVLRTTFIQQHLTATFKPEAALVTFFLQDMTILQTCLDSETDTPAHAQAYLELYILIYKGMWLIEKLKLTAKELKYFQNNTNFQNFNWKDFKFAAWLQVADFVSLRNSLPTAEKDLLSIFETADKAGDITKAIIEITAWDKANVEFFVSKHAATDFLNEVFLIILQQQTELSQRIGVSIEKLTSWATDSVTNEQARDIKRTLKAKYDETAWIEVSTQVHNRLRTRLRDALVAYLLQKPEIKKLGLKDSNDLYSYFLIDVEMDACMLTSRLKQAIASVQLFVQRCLLNLESIKTDPKHIILPSQIDANQWKKWMKNYRVWEANRKVFLYPENWIEPELRDNKSPFFKELESELLQGEVTNDSVEKALMNYLEKLHDVARLDICGSYEDTEAQEFHVFGRTFNSPPQYFYRKLDLNTQVWTAWEKVQLDIQGSEEGESAGVHLMPVVWNRRLYLFWAIFTEKSDKEKIQQDNENYKKRQNEIKDWEDRQRELDHIEMIQAQEGKPGKFLRGKKPEELPEENNPWAYYEVRLAWSEYRQNKWSNKKVSQSFIRTKSDRLGVAATYIYRFSVILGSTLTIKLLYHPSMLIPVGEYRLNCNGKASVFDDDPAPIDMLVINPKQVNFYQGFLSATNSGRSIFWHEKESFPLILRDRKNDKKILAASEQEYKVLFPADHDFSNNSSSKLIYQDHKRNYYVEPEFYVLIEVGGLRDRRKLTITPLKQDVVKPTKTINKGDPVPFQAVDRFKQLSSAQVNTLLDQGQIKASTSMQIRELQTLPASASVTMETKNLSFAAANIGNTYFNPRRFSMTKLKFNPFFHAYVCNFMEDLGKNGIDGLLNLHNQAFSEFIFAFSTKIRFDGLYFQIFYQPNTDNVATPYPAEDVDFSPNGAYSLYNWELFFHIPMLLANRLSKNQRFEEAMRWYHFVFNPTTNDSLNSSARYWQVIPFRNTAKETLEELFDRLSKPPSDPNRRELENAITAWRNNPFSPHLIARMRLCAYQKNTVMKYIDNLLAWADKLFSRDTIESINEATQLYILAAELLGKRPEKIPARGNIQALNYAELEAKGLDAFSNALVQLETFFPNYSLQAVQQDVQSTASILNTTTPALYFCLPDNDKLLGYWDTVADRLFKIRHCQNIEGIERQLALFEPPIDPALLVQAVAGGVDISSVLADLNSPLPYYRFNYILQKALEICAELKSLGNSLLSALEKKDGETLAMMRTQHETLLLSMAKTVKKLQITEAKRNREGLEKTQEVTKTRFDYYSELISTKLIEAEKENAKKLEVAKDRQDDAYGVELAGNLAHLIPDFSIGLLPRPSLGFSLGGSNVGSALNAWARSINYVASGYTYEANRSSINATNERRFNEWVFQQSVAKKELTQIDKQILAAQIREQIAENELSNHEQQIDNAHQVEDFYRNKYTQEELYGWMVGEISTVYFQCYQLAYDLAKKAEKTYRYELGLPTSNFVQFGIWDSFRKGLMSGERLYLSLKQMEKSYMDQNRREYEITKNISLLLHDPMALISLKETGTCFLELPETLFDIDYPGHYMRRIKSASITIPCVVGPYTSINCTLTLLSSETRVKSTTPYAKKQPEDDRFVQNFAAMQSIATSTAQNDSGLFELNFRDERYLPFEGSGVISRWRIELPNNIRQFDYQTITDVVLHLKYTARDGGVALRKEADTNLHKILNDDTGKLQSRLFSLRHEFSTEWYKLISTANKDGNHSQTFSFNKQRFPIVFKNGVITVKKVDVFGNPKILSSNITDVPSLDKLILSDPDGQIPLKDANKIGFLIHKASDVDVEVKDLGLNKNETDWTITVNKSDVAVSLEKLDDILILFQYTVVLV